MLPLGADGMIKLVWDPDSGRVLGGSIVGYRASEVITTVALAVKAQLTVELLAEGRDLSTDKASVTAKTYKAVPQASVVHRVPRTPATQRQPRRSKHAPARARRCCDGGGCGRYRRQ